MYHIDVEALDLESLRAFKRYLQDVASEKASAMRKGGLASAPNDPDTSPTLQSPSESCRHLSSPGVIQRRLRARNGATGVRRRGTTAQSPEGVVTALSPELVAFRGRRSRLLDRDIGVEVVTPHRLDGFGRPFVSLNRELAAMMLPYTSARRQQEDPAMLKTSAASRAA
jgi:hypothetical protein